MSASPAPIPAWMKHPKAFLDAYLSQTCPLLQAAREALRSEQHEQLTGSLTGLDWDAFLKECDDWYRSDVPSSLPRDRPSTLLQARRSLVLAALGNDTTSHLQTAVAKYSEATQYSLHPAIEADCRPAGQFRHTAVRERLVSRSAGRAPRSR